jgi:class 3 adenylate cyclase
MGFKGANNTDTGKRGPWLRRALAQLRVKLTLPYVCLALVIAFVATFFVTNLIVGLLEDLFKDALIQAGQEAADTVVRVERDQLADLRRILYTVGFDDAVVARDEDAVNLLATPLVVNAQLDSMVALDAGGDVILEMHHLLGGGVTDYDTTPAADYGELEMVQKVLAGEVDEIDGELHDKYADLIETQHGWTFYTAGPVKKQSQVVGVVLVGTYLDNLVKRLDNATLARVSIYRDGKPIATTMLEETPLSEETYQDALARQERWVTRRQVEVVGEDHAEVLSAFEARYGRDLGVLSVSLPLSMVTGVRLPTLWRLMIVFSISILVTIAIGVVLAGGVVRRVQQLDEATGQVASGDLETQVPVRGYDEISSLAEDFNAMVVQLREERRYRDLLGLTTSPEVIEQLRRALERGRVHLDPQLATATVLFCDIRAFTRLSESKEPKDVIGFLNEYMQGVVEIVRDHNGVINKFAGDAALAFYGLLRDPRASAENAGEAIATAWAILEFMAGLNRQRAERGEQALRVGIGIGTGSVVAGLVGSDTRQEYTVLGDAVKIARRLSDLNKEHPQYDAFFCASTYQELEESLQRRSVHIGEIVVKGRAAPVDAYALQHTPGP